MPDNPEVILEPFHLTSGDAGNTEGDGTANAWADIWKYQVPRGTEIVLSPGDTFSCYLEDGSPAEIGDRDAKVRIQVRDPAEGSDILVFGPSLYIHSKEQQDDDLIARLKIRESMRVPSRYWIVISAYDGATIDASDSYYDLYLKRVRKGVAVVSP